MRRLFVVCLLLAVSGSSAQQTAGKTASGQTYTVTKGKVVKRVELVIPPGLTAKAITKGVVVKLIIDKEGVPKDIQVIKGDPILAKAAVEALRQWRYKPYKLNGEAVEVESSVYITFEPARE
jgi:TonB family protein